MTKQQQQILLDNKLEALRREYVKPGVDRKMLEIRAKLIQKSQAYTALKGA